MTTRTDPARRATLAVLLAIALAAVVPASSGAAQTSAKLRVLTPTKVLDPGTTYIVDGKVTVPTTADADCFGPPGGSGAEYTYDQPTALSLLATAARTTGKVRPLALTDQFGFGLGICGIGGEVASPGQSFWYLKANHQESTVGADQLKVRSGDQVLFYLAPDNFPNPNPAELELKAPPRVEAGKRFDVTVVQHACVTDQQTFEVSCASQPAAGASVSATGPPLTTGADGRVQLTAGSPGTLKVAATRGADIPSQALAVCVGVQLGDCPAARGERIVGSPNGDRIKGTRGSDSIRARGGDDRVDLRKGGADRLDCGPGKDSVLVARGADDEMARDCERVRRR
jgi:RTX calcium-binding nonapeptide repeat (4 copies)